MTSPRYLPPKAVHAPISNQLYVNKRPYVSPDNANSTVLKNHPLTKNYDERRRATKSIPKPT